MASQQRVHHPDNVRPILHPVIQRLDQDRLSDKDIHNILIRHKMPDVRNAYLLLRQTIATQARKNMSGDVQNTQVVKSALNYIRSFKTPRVKKS